MFKLDWTEFALNGLDKLENVISRRIIKKVEELAVNPISKDVIRLKGSSDFRLRVGDYRVIFMLEGNKIFILKVGHRKKIYDR